MTRDKDVPGDECPARSRAGNPFQPGTATPKVDHFAITIADWNKDRVEDELKRRGFKKKTSKGFGLGPMEYRPDTDDSFHVSDPDGFDLQIAGAGMKP